jgi:hypothetical protein
MICLPIITNAYFSGRYGLNRWLTGCNLVFKIVSLRLERSGREHVVKLAHHLCCCKDEIICAMAITYAVPLCRRERKWLDAVFSAYVR